MRWRVLLLSFLALAVQATIYAPIYKQAYIPADADVIAYQSAVASVGGSLSTNTLGAIEAFVLGLKGDGVWAKIQWLAPFCGPNLPSARILLKYPSGVSSNMLNSGGFAGADYAETGSAGGLKGNGSSKYLDSGFNPVTQLSSLTDFHMFAYVQAPETNGTSQALMGANVSGSDKATLLGWFSGGSKEGGDIAGMDNVSTFSPTPGTQPREGFLGITVNGTRSQQYYYDGAEVATAVTSTGTAHPNSTLFIHARNRGGSAGVFGNRYLRLVSIGTGLSATDATNFFLRAQTLETALSRNLYWKSELLLSGGRFDSLADAGGGTLFTGSRLPTYGHIYKTVDYGKTWADSGPLIADDITSLQTNGSATVFALCGTNSHLLKTINTGSSWFDLGQVSTNTATATFNRTYGLCVTAVGSVLVADTLSTGGHVFRSINGGTNFTDLGAVGAAGHYHFNLVGNGILLNGFHGKVFKSTDDGQNWVEKLSVGSPLYADGYLGNGICLQGSEAGHIYRSIDNGDNWSDLGVVGALADSFAPIGNGVVFYSTYGANKHTYRSSDFGVTWSDLGLFGPVAGDALDCAISYVNEYGMTNIIGVSNLGYVIRGL